MVMTEVKLNVAGIDAPEMTDDEHAAQIKEFQARQDARLAERIALKASPKYRKMLRDKVKTKWTRRRNRMAAPAGKFLCIVPKSVALYNMCGDNAYKRGTV